MTLRPGTRLGPYEILAPLGAGGMGEVYRARDTRLGRDVAVKVLPPEFAANPDRLRRFEQEAKATAALDHPNILSVFDIGTHEGTPYIVEQLLEGESLRQRLRGGALPPTKAVELAIQVAQGLAAAHAKGIVHRDLKPENLFVAKDGRIKILDFGLARLRAGDPLGEEGRSQAETADLPTREGTILGTVGYMAPEQVRGQAVDGRADLFAFGCVLYEMLAGHRAFQGTTQTDVAASILKEDPPALPRGPGRVLAPLVGRCLQKNPADRYASAEDLLRDLAAASGSGGALRFGWIRGTRARKRFAAAALAAIALAAALGAVTALLERTHRTKGAGPPPKIVVFPFENLGAPEDNYFAAGMADEISSRLANVTGLGVISRTSATQYGRAGKTMRQVGRDLGVDYVLEGSVRWEKGPGEAHRVRITPQLIRVSDDTQVWSDRYDRVMADVFAIQTEVAESAVRAMGFTLAPREKSALKEVATTDLEAYDLYLRAQEVYSRSFTREDTLVAIRLYEAAVDRDPKFAQAWAGLAGSQLRMHWYYFDRSPERLAGAKEAAERAVALRPDLAETHRALGTYYYQGLRDYPRALAEFGTALGIQPDNDRVLTLMSAVLMRMGRWDEAADTQIRARALNPGNLGQLWQSMGTCIMAGRYAQADRDLDRAIAATPQDVQLHASKAYLYLIWRGDLDGALAILQNARAIPGLKSGAERVRPVVEFMILIDRRDYRRALDLLAENDGPAIDLQYLYTPISLLRAHALDLAGQRAAARQAFEAARRELEDKVRQAPEDSRVHSALGIAYAGLGRPEDALREARRGCELMPVSTDAWLGRWRLSDLALVCTMLGRPDEAISHLEALMPGCGWFTPNLYRLDPRFDPLRTNPRFEALLAKYENRP